MYIFVQCKYLKLFSGDHAPEIFILQNLILRTRSCGTGFITQSSWVFYFHLTTLVTWKYFVPQLYQFRRGILGGPALKYFDMIHRGGRNSADSRVLGCHPAIFHGRQKSIFSQLDWSRQSSDTAFLLVVYQVARCLELLPPPLVPWSRYASSRTWLGSGSMNVECPLKHHSDSWWVFEFQAVLAVLCLGHCTHTL